MSQHNRSSIEMDYFDAIRQRLRLFARLAGKRRSTKTKKRVKQCFSLPDRCFNFVPILPPDLMNYPPQHSANHNNNNSNTLHFQEMDEEFDELEHEPMMQEDDGDDDDANNFIIPEHEMELFDPPPVEFTCDSFSLTSPGIGTEYVLLNPYSGSIEVYHSILDNARGSEERWMEWAMYDASENIVRKRMIGMEQQQQQLQQLGGGENNDLDERSEDIAGEAIHSRMIQSKMMYDTPPTQILFGIQEYFDLNLEEYFGRWTPFGAGRRGNVTVDWVGVDTHVAASEDGRCVKGNLIGAARILTMESEDGVEEDLNCTEVFAWSNIDSNESVHGTTSKYTSKFVCRAAGSFYFLDICANTQKLYATFQAGSGRFHEAHLNSGDDGARDRNRSLMEIDDESLVNEDGEPIRMSRSIYRLPLVKYEDQASGPDVIGSYFPLPEACIVAQYPVSSFSVDISGQILIVGTIHGTVEMWHTGMHSAPARLEILSVRESFLRRARSMTIGARARIELESDDKPTSIECCDSTVQGHETQDDLALVDGNNEDDLPHKNPTCKISQIYLPRHLPVQSCGFVTKQRDSESGTTLLLWQSHCMTTDSSSNIADQRFQIVSMINVPLSSRCHPEVHYDGRRLIVFGQDHIGLIFLVYHVLGTRYDQDEFHNEKTSSERRGKGNEESGGVVNLLDERRVKFVNRIRHAGLGGLEYFDSFIMTANERFIVVNTKTGHLVAPDGTRNASQGLLVIDLQEHYC